MYAGGSGLGGCDRRQDLEGRQAFGTDTLVLARASAAEKAMAEVEEPVWDDAGEVDGGAAVHVQVWWTLDPHMRHCKEGRQG